MTIIACPKLMLNLKMICTNTIFYKCICSSYLNNSCRVSWHVLQQHRTVNIEDIQLLWPHFKVFVERTFEFSYFCKLMYSNCVLEQSVDERKDILLIAHSVCLFQNYIITKKKHQQIQLISLQCKWQHQFYQIDCQYLYLAICCHSTWLLINTIIKH